MKIRFLLEAPPLAAEEKRAGVRQYAPGEVADLDDATAKQFVRDGYAEAVTEPKAAK